MLRGACSAAVLLLLRLGVVSALGDGFVAQTGGPTALARLWDELRLVDVDPNRISTMPLASATEGGLGGLSQVYSFDKDWLRIEGATDPSNFISSDYQFQRLAYPHEWSAKAPLWSEVRLRVGRQCNCTLTGISAYMQSDQTAWLRLQFESCGHCESTAPRAAVVFPIMPDAAEDSNIFTWMCAISDHEACQVAKPETSKRPVKREETTSTTTPIPTANPCNFAGAVGVRTQQVELGTGRCLGELAPRKGRKVVAPSNDSHTAASFEGCHITCDLTYTAEAISYSDLKDINSHVAEINLQPEVCKGFAYNEATKQCLIYRGDVSIGLADKQVGWLCVGQVHAGMFEYQTNFGLDCTTPPPTTTFTTTFTVTSTTSTTTTELVASLNLKDLFDPEVQSTKLFYGEAHFPRRGVEATLMQLQSHCFQAPIDYYLMGAQLSVSEAQWPLLLRLISEFGAPVAWPSPEENDCQASVTVDRIPVDADILAHGTTVSLHGAAQSAWRFFLPLFLGAGVVALALMIKGCFYPEGHDALTKLVQLDLLWLLLGALVACVAAALIAYWAGQFFSWFVGRLAVKRFAYGGSADWLAAAPVLSQLCLPTALTVGCAVLLMWLWPREEKEHVTQRMTQHLHLQYDPRHGLSTSVMPHA